MYNWKVGFCEAQGPQLVFVASSIRTLRGESAKAKRLAKRNKVTDRAKVNFFINPPYILKINTISK
jgi:hypothetical protein